MKVVSISYLKRGLTRLDKEYIVGESQGKGGQR